VKSRMLGIMSVGEIAELVRSGFDIELHSHRHRFPAKREDAIREIDDNRSVLEPVTGKRLKHFCYPSGVWSEQQWSWLAEAGIESAVTTDLGLNVRGTPKYGLKRFGDGDILSQIEFEAEVSGFAELLRAPRSAFASAVRVRR
jgi:peptidoglycan/xylan/chitin deacetylase (PgdA/CDA1 family)